MVIHLLDARLRVVNDTPFASIFPLPTSATAPGAPWLCGRE